MALGQEPQECPAPEHEETERPGSADDAVELLEEHQSGIRGEWCQRERHHPRTASYPASKRRRSANSSTSDGGLASTSSCALTMRWAQSTSACASACSAWRVTAARACSIRAVSACTRPAGGSSPGSSATGSTANGSPKYRSAALRNVRFAL